MLLHDKGIAQGQEGITESRKNILPLIPQIFRNIPENADAFPLRRDFANFLISNCFCPWGSRCTLFEKSPFLNVPPHYGDSEVKGRDLPDLNTLNCEGAIENNTQGIFQE